MKEGLYQPADKTELEEVGTNKDWEVPVKDDQVWLRLMGTDKVDNTNSQTIQVEIPSVVQTRKGGIIASDDQRAELYLPPNTLAQDAIATVNALTETEVEPPVRRGSQIYDFAPATLRLNSIKPATLHTPMAHHNSPRWQGPLDPSSY